MSSSAKGSITAGQNVIYQVNFTTNQNAANAPVGALVLDFCYNSPIIGDTCTVPTGFNLNAGSLSINNQSGLGGDNFSIDTVNSTASRLILTRTNSNIATATAVSFELGNGTTNGVTNPTPAMCSALPGPPETCTFYARVLTFQSSTGAVEYESDDIDDANDDSGTGGNGPHTIYDAGGFALSTAEQLTITAKVPEKLTFCIYTTIGSANTCTSPSGNSITLGDNNGVLSESEEFINSDALYTVATNALYGVAIRVKGGTLKTNPSCSDTTGPDSICRIEPIGATASPNVVGTEQFGFCTYDSADPSATLTAAAPYNDTECTAGNVIDNSGVAGNGVPNDAAVTDGAPDPDFAFDVNTTDGTGSTYGDTFANKAAGTFSTGVLAFIGNITTTTEPGIYTTTLTFIATGTY